MAPVRKKEFKLSSPPDVWEKDSIYYILNSELSSPDLHIFDHYVVGSDSTIYHVSTVESIVKIIDSKKSDLQLIVTQDDQVEFNIFDKPNKSNLFINDSIYFEGISYSTSNISGSWRLIWNNEFLLKTTDLIIFRNN